VYVHGQVHAVVHGMFVFMFVFMQNEYEHIHTVDTDMYVLHMNMDMT
jgi:hypothetical protein